MQPQFLIPLAMIVIVGAVLAGAADAAVTAGSTTLGDAQSDLNTIMNFKVFGIREMSVFGQSVSIPTLHVGFIGSLFNILTWDYSYLSGGMWNLLRYFLMTLTFATGILVFIHMGPVILAIAEFIGRTAAAVVGVFASSFRGIFRS